MEIKPPEIKEIGGHKVKLSKDTIADHYACRELEDNRRMYFSGLSMDSVWKAVKEEIKENGMDNFLSYYSFY